MSMTMQERREWVREQLQGMEAERVQGQPVPESVSEPERARLNLLAEPVSAWDSNSFRHRVKRLFRRSKNSKK